MVDAMDFPVTLKVLPLGEAITATLRGGGRIFSDVRSLAFIEEARGLGRPKLVAFGARYGEFFLGNFLCVPNRKVRSGCRRALCPS